MKDGKFDRCWCQLGDFVAIFSEFSDPSSDSDVEAGIILALLNEQQVLPWAPPPSQSTQRRPSPMNGHGHRRWRSNFEQLLGQQIATFLTEDLETVYRGTFVELHSYQGFVFSSWASSPMSCHRHQKELPKRTHLQQASAVLLPPDWGGFWEPFKMAGWDQFPGHRQEDGGDTKYRSY